MPSDHDKKNPLDGMQLIPVSSAAVSAGHGAEFTPVSNTITPSSAGSYSLTVSSKQPAGSASANGYVNVLFLLQNASLSYNGATVASPDNAGQLGYVLQQLGSQTVDSSGNATHVALVAVTPVTAGSPSSFQVITFGQHVALEPVETNIA